MLCPKTEIQGGNMTSENLQEETAEECCYCRQKITLAARVCHHCGRNQNIWLNRLQHIFTFTGFLTALIMVLLGIGQ